MNLAALLLVSLLPAAPAATVGQLSFPVSCKPPAQRAFTRGVLALHSFWYAEALAQFRAAQKADGACAMAFWGEALANVQLLWNNDDLPAARAALAKMPAEPPTARERDWVAALKPLIASDDPWANRAGFADAMEQLYRAHPDDDEVKAFLALALLVRSPTAYGDLALQARAAALAMEVTAHNPDHPGALHYTIHALDTPELAPMGLPAARRYARIAPEAFHARHMPAHIFSRLGLWPDALASCESAWQVSERWVKSAGLSSDHRDFHSLSWIVTVNVEMGRLRRAEAALATFAEAAHGGVPWLRIAYVNSLWQHLRATGQWASLDARLAALGAAPSVPATVQAPACHGPSKPYAEWEAIDVASLRAEAAAARRDTAELDRRIAERKQLEARSAAYDERRQGKESFARRRRMEELTDAALRAQARGDALTEAARWREVAVLEEVEPPAEGADDLGGPHELAGEALLRAGRAGEAMAELALSLKQHPGHAATVLELGRAAAKLGDVASARTHFARAAQMWSQAEPDFAPAAEARAWLAAHPMSAGR
jgi:hypothetical protein